MVALVSINCVYMYPLEVQFWKYVYMQHMYLYPSLNAKHFLEHFQLEIANPQYLWAFINLVSNKVISYMTEISIRDTHTKHFLEHLKLKYC